MNRAAIAASSLPGFLIPCPACAGRMKIKLIRPAMFAEDVDDVTHRCDGCGAELTRSIRRAKPGEEAPRGQ
jgi:hypothetical protein